MEIGNIQPLALCPSGANPTSMLAVIAERARIKSVADSVFRSALLADEVRALTENDIAPWDAALELRLG